MADLKPCPFCGSEVEECPNREPRIGDYVLATKYEDGDPGDAWALGFFTGKLPKAGGDRYMVADAAGNQFRANGFRRIKRISPEVGAWLLRAAKSLEQAPPGAVNLWNMLQVQGPSTGVETGD